MKGLLYILQSKEGRKYIGSTTNIKRRLGEHKRKSDNSRYTKSFEHIKLIYQKEFETIEEARRVEQRIKKSRFERDKLYKVAGLTMK